MPSDEPWKNSKPGDSGESPAKGEGESRFVDAKEMEQRETYESYYRRLYPLLTGGELDFRQISKKIGLKERKIHDVLLFRLAGDDMIQLFGHRGGVCYLCASRMRGNLTDEPLCIPCIEAIGQAVDELYPVEGLPSQASKPDTAIPDTGNASAVLLSSYPSVIQPPPGDMVPRAQLDAIYRELERYRAKYGPLNEVEACPLGEIPPTPQTVPTDHPPEPVDYSANPAPETAEAVSPVQDILAILEGDGEEFDDIDENIQYVTLSLDKAPGGAPRQATAEPLRHFGFQRLKSRN